MQIQSRHGKWIATAAVALAMAGLLAATAWAGPGNKASGTQKIASRETATFAAGCFWSMEAIFKQLNGVYSADPGYAGGKPAHPTYEQVETGTTGHAESLNIVFDPKVITYRELLEVLLTVRDPTSVNRQGNDEGPQYRSIIFYRNDAQKRDANEMIAKFNATHVWPRPIVTKVQPFSVFYPAEDYHKDFYKNNATTNDYCRNVVAPEIAEFRAKFKARLKK